MTTTPAPEADDREVITLRPSPWEEATQKADLGHVVHVADDTGEHRYVVMTEEQYLAIEEAAEDAEHRAWQIRNRDRLHTERERFRAGEHGIELNELMRQLDAADAQ